MSLENEELAQPDEERILISSGSTILNLALSGNPWGGWQLGRVSNIVGDSATGKSLLAIEAAALFLAAPPKGIVPRVTYFETEAAFDSSYAAQLGLPISDVDFQKAHTVEDVFGHLEELCTNPEEVEEGKVGHLVILDSLDAISSRAELDQEIDKGTFGVSKQKQMHALFRRLIQMLESSNVHFMIISQTREVINPGMFGKKQYRTGGKSLDFFSSFIVWLAQAGTIKSAKTGWVTGVNCVAKVTKNRIAAADRVAYFPILRGYGVDDLASMVDYLADKSLLELVDNDLLIIQKGNRYLVWEGHKSYQYKEIVEAAEADKSLHRDLLDRVVKVWRAMEEASKSPRLGGKQQRLAELQEMGSDDSDETIEEPEQGE